MSNRLGLLNSLVGLGKNELDVARVRHVGVNLQVIRYGSGMLRIDRNLHGRERGMCAFAAWGPG